MEHGKCRISKPKLPTQSGKVACPANATQIRSLRSFS
jgi:hypothetical protein